MSRCTVEQELLRTGGEFERALRLYATATPVLRQES